MQPDQLRSRHGVVEVAVDGLLDVAADLLDRLALGVNAVPERACRVPAVHFVFGDFEDESRSCSRLPLFAGAEDLGQQPLRLLLQPQNIRPNLGQRPHRLRRVEVACEADLVADLHTVRLVPDVGRVRQDLAPQERRDAAVFLQRDLLGIAQVGIRLVLHDSRPAVNVGREQATQRVGLRAALVDLPEDRRRILAALAGLLQRLDLGRLVDAVRVGTCDA